jgi:hypothetical protein
MMPPCQGWIGYGECRGGQHEISAEAGHS